MAEMIARIAGEWMVVEGENVPKLPNEYGIICCCDVAGTLALQLISNPNVGEWEVVADEDVIADIDKDGDYNVLWCEYVPVDEVA